MAKTAEGVATNDEGAVAEFIAKLEKLITSWNARYVPPESFSPEDIAIALATEKGLAIAAVELRKAINGDN